LLVNLSCYYQDKIANNNSSTLKIPLCVFASSASPRESLFEKFLNIICSGACGAAAAGPICMEELAAWFINPLVGVRAEIVPLCLEQIRREPPAAVTVKVLKSA